MPVTKIQRTPGVYVTEEDAFPPTIVGVQTAVPAFVGYTEQANLAGKPLYNKPIKISSFAEYVAIFGEGFAAERNVTSKTESEVRADPTCYDVSFIDDSGATLYYAIDTSAVKTFALHASVKLFYDNGGDVCYVTSVGNYTNSGEVPAGVDVTYHDLNNGLTAVGELIGPTMLVIPDATLLTPKNATDWWDCDDFYTLVNNMLVQCGDKQDRIAVIDVYGTQNLNQRDPAAFEQDLGKLIAWFRDKTPTANLSYGATYFPFLRTSVYSGTEFDFTYFEYVGLKDALEKQADAIYPQTTQASKDKRLYVQDLIDDADVKSANYPTDEAGIDALNGKLTNALPVLKEMEAQLALMLGVLPPSGVMAGIMSQVDSDKGVWNAPANVSLSSVVGPTVDINNDQQADLNVPLDGKAIDVIRSFPGRGTVPWGARTMLGNSNDWRYLQIRRTLIFIEQSIKNAMMPFVFAANDGKTWSTVVSAISNFLQQTWSQGGLMGNTPQQAFTVECGLGSTMTTQDLLEGYMVVEVRVAMVRPAEFIVLNFKQKMPEA